ncbi:unnamed protein product [Symbiodinium sp. CCMP2456]|nr:unnamed protein product [Symbiodinium sp. CCMP2456]
MDADAIGAVPWVYYIPVVNVLYDANAVPPSMQQIDQILETFSTLNGLLLSVCIPTVVLFSPADSLVARARNWNGSYDRYRFFSLSAMFCITAASVSTSLTYLFTRATDFEGAAGVSLAYVSWWRYTRWSFLFLILGTVLGSACLSLAIQYAFVLQHAQGQAEADLLSRFMGNWSFYSLLGLGFVVPLAVVSLATLVKQTAIHAVGRIASTSNRQFRPAPKSLKTDVLHNCPVLNIFYDMLFVQVPSSGKINSVMAMLILFNSLLLAVSIPMLQLFDDEKAANARRLNWDGEYDEFKRQVTRGYVFIASAMFQVVCTHLSAVAGTFDSNTAGVGSAVAAWWKVARWNLVVTGSCTCAGSMFLYRAAHLAFKLQHMTTAKEGQEIGRYQDNSLFAVVLGLGVAFPLLVLSLAHSRRHRAMNHDAPAKEERQLLHRAHYLPVLNIFYDFFASLPETGQLLQVLEVNGTMIALMLGMGAEVLHLLHFEEAEVSRNRDWDGGYVEFSEMSHDGFSLLFASLVMFVLTYLYAAMADFTDSRGTRNQSTFTVWWSWSRFCVFAVMLYEHYGIFRLYQAQPRLYYLQHETSDEAAWKLWKLQEFLCYVAIGFGECFPVVVLSLALFRKQQMLQRSDSLSNTHSQETTRWMWAYSIPVFNLVYDVLLDHTPEWDQIVAMMKTFLFLAGLLMQMSLKVLLLFPYDEAAIVQQRSWLGTYESYEFWSHAAWLLGTCGLATFFYVAQFASMTSFKRDPEDTEINRSALSGWWYWARWCIVLLLLDALGAGLAIIKSAQEAYVLQHSRTREEAEELSAAFLPVTWTVLPLGIVLPVVILSVSLLRTQSYSNALVGARSDRNESDVTVSTRLYRVAGINVLYDLFFDKPPAVNQIAEMLYIFGVLNAFLLSILLPLLIKFGEPADMDLARSRNWVGSYDSHRNYSSLGLACTMSAVWQILLTYVCTQASSRLEGGEVKKWWSLVRWLVISIGVFSGLGLVLLVLASLQCYIMQHATVAQEAAQLQSQANMFCLMLFGPAAFLPLLLLSLGVRSRQREHDNAKKPQASTKNSQRKGEAAGICDSISDLSKCPNDLGVETCISTHDDTETMVSSFTVPCQETQMSLYEKDVNEPMCWVIFEEPGADLQSHEVIAKPCMGVQGVAVGVCTQTQISEMQLRMYAENIREPMSFEHF